MQRRLHEGDLDRSAGLDEDERGRVDQQQGTQRGRGVDVRPGGPQALGGRVARCLLDVGVKIEQERGAEQEGGDVDQQRSRHAGSRRDDAADYRSHHERDREGDVERGVRAALGRLRVLVDAREPGGLSGLSCVSFGARGYLRHEHLLGFGCSAHRVRVRERSAGHPRDLRAQQRVRRQRRGPVEEGEHEHRGQRETPYGGGERGRGDSLEEVQRAQHAAAPGCLGARDHGRDQECRQRLPGQQKRRDAQRAVRVVEHGERQSDQAEPAAEAVDRVREEDPAQPARLERLDHAATLLSAQADGRAAQNRSQRQLDPFREPASVGASDPESIRVCGGSCRPKGAASRRPCAGT